MFSSFLVYNNICTYHQSLLIIYYFNILKVSGRTITIAGRLDAGAFRACIAYADDLQTLYVGYQRDEASFVYSNSSNGNIHKTGKTVFHC